MSMNGMKLILCYTLFLATSRSEAFATTTFRPATFRGGAATVQQNVLAMPPTNGDVSLSDDAADDADKNQDRLTTTTTILSKVLSKKNGIVNGKQQQPQPQHEASSTSTSSTTKLNNEATFVAETNLPTDMGDFKLRAYRTASPSSNPFVGNEPCVIYSADKPPFGHSHVPVRVHDQCITSEVFGSNRCDCKEQLRMALESVQKHGGAIIYLQQEGRGIGLANKVAAYALQDSGMDTVDANLHLGFPEDDRQYCVIPSILQDLRVDSIQLMTNNPRKVDRLAALGVNVQNTLPMVVHMANPYNRKYLETKQKRMNHLNLGDMLSRPNGSTMIPQKKTVIKAATPSPTTAPTPLDDASDSNAGVVAQDDGYCFGRQSVVDAIAAIADGDMVCVVDDLNRENEGDFIMAADACTPEQMAKIVRYSSGVVCIAMEDQRMKELQLHPMVANNEDPKETAFSITVDGSKHHGITTGISATDRAKTVRMLADPKMTASDFSRPGHIFPLRARAGGVLERNGHTEATVDLARLAGRGNCGVLCEIVSEENPTEMARLPELMKFCRAHNLVLTSIADLQQYRREEEGHV